MVLYSYICTYSQLILKKLNSAGEIIVIVMIMNIKKKFVVLSVDLHKQIKQLLALKHNRPKLGDLVHISCLKNVWICVVVCNSSIFRTAVFDFVNVKPGCEEFCNAGLVTVEEVGV